MCFWKSRKTSEPPAIRRKSDRELAEIIVKHCPTKSVDQIEKLISMPATELNKCFIQRCRKCGKVGHLLPYIPRSSDVSIHENCGGQISWYDDITHEQYDAMSETEKRDLQFRSTMDSIEEEKFLEQKRKELLIERLHTPSSKYM